MKNNRARFLIILYAAMLALLLVIFLKGGFDSSHYGKLGIVVVGFVVGIIRILLGSKKQTKELHARYRHAYREFTEGVFEWDSKLENSFYKALEEYNGDRPATALKLLQKLEPQCLTREDVYGVTAFIALCLNDMHENKAAVEKYDEALAIKESCILASNMGLCLQHMGNSDRAAECYKKAAAIDPTNPMPHINLAFRAIRLGEYEEGRVHAQHAVELAPQHPKALKAMAICCLMLNDEESYQSFYRRAVANGVGKEELDRYVIRDFAAELEAARAEEV